MMIPWNIFLFVVGFQVVLSQIEERDESGLRTLRETAILGLEMCDKIKNVESMMESPLTLGFGKKMLSTSLPFPGPAMLDPFNFFGFLTDHIGSLEDQLTNEMEGKEIITDIKNQLITKNPTTVKPTGTDKFLSVQDLLQMGKFVCKGARFIFVFLSSKFADFVGISHWRLPIPDPDHPINWMKAIDIFNYGGMPDRFNRLLTGQLGFTSTTTTTPKPSFSLFSFGHSSSAKEQAQPKQNNATEQTSFWG